MRARSYVWTAVLGIGLLALFAGERLVGAGTWRAAFSLAGVALVLGSLLVRALRAKGAADERRQAERLFLLLGGAVLAALLLYGVQSDLWAKLLGTVRLERTSPKLAVVLAALWPALLVVGLLPTLLAELAYAAMHRAPKVEAGRVRDAALSGAGLAAVAVFAFSAYYVAAERDVKWDLSYFRTARPGEATRNVVRALEDQVTVTVFFPPANEVRENVLEYLTDLAKESDRVVLAVHDHALEPKLARELGVTGNGTVVVARGERRELLGLGLDLQRARGQLRSLDKEFNRRLVTVARPRRTIYFTTGHGERASDRGNPTDQRWTVRSVRELFSQQNHEVKNLGVAEGLAGEIPGDAAAVVVLGPTQPFLPEVEQALVRYLDRGGRVLLALDAEAGLEMAGVLGKYGLRFDPAMLANDQVFLPRTRKSTDRINLVTASYSSHPAVTSLGRMGQRAPLLLIGAGSLKELPDRGSDLRVDFTVHAHAATFIDANQNFEHDTGELRNAFGLAAAVTRTQKKGEGEGEPGPEARLVVLADSEVLSDPLLENTGNAYLALDSMKWLLGEEQLAGEVASEEDVPVQHTRSQDVAWFYATIFLVPGLVLGAGFWFSRGGRRKARKEAAR